MPYFSGALLRRPQVEAVAHGRAEAESEVSPCKAALADNILSPLEHPWGIAMQLLSLDAHSEEGPPKA